MSEIRARHLHALRERIAWLREHAQIREPDRTGPRRRELAALEFALGEIDVLERLQKPRT